MRQKRIRTRRHRPALYGFAALLLAGGCGGGGGETAPPPPRIERAAAERLAATSESIAELLDQGDVCTAAGRADELLAQTVEAINAGGVPVPFQEDLTSKANELVNEVNCPRPPPVEEEDEDDDEDNKGDDEEERVEELPPIELPPIEDEEDDD